MEEALQRVEDRVERIGAVLRNDASPRPARPPPPPPRPPPPPPAQVHRPETTAPPAAKGLAHYDGSPIPILVMACNRVTVRCVVHGWCESKGGVTFQRGSRQSRCPPLGVRWTSS